VKLVAAGSGRADFVVGSLLEGVGRRRLGEAFEAGEIRVNGRRVKKGDRVATGDAIEIADGSAALADLTPVAWNAPFEVLFVDDRLVAGNKPATWASHPLRARETGTYANALVARFPACASAGKDPREAGLVHRLDAGTSGIIVAARSRAAWEEIRAGFSSVTKTYLALVAGAVAGGGQIVEPIGDQPAATRYVVERAIGDRTLLRCTLSAGRMHQVRVHLAGIGHPIVGDATYGGPPEPRIDGHFLHALRVELPELVGIEAPLPADRAALLG
jgi:23S rRNA pseudouridine1911/1915/1917 synthase